MVIHAIIKCGKDYPEKSMKGETVHVKLAAVYKVKAKVLILDGNSEIGAQVRSILLYFICLRHLLRSRAVQLQIDFFSSKQTYVPLYLRNMFWVTIWYKYSSEGSQRF